MIEAVILVFYTALALVFLTSLVQLIRGGRDAAAQAQNRIAACILAGIAIVVAAPTASWLFDLKTFKLTKNLDSSFAETTNEEDIAYPAGTYYYRGSTITGDGTGETGDFAKAVGEGRLLPWGGIIDKVLDALYIVGGLFVIVGIMIAAIELRARRRPVVSLPVRACGLATAV